MIVRLVDQRFESHSNELLSAFQLELSIYVNGVASAAATPDRPVAGHRRWVSEALGQAENICLIGRAFSQMFSLEKRNKVGKSGKYL